MSLCPLGKTFNANFLTGSLCGVERQLMCLFHNGIYTGEKNRKQVDMVLPGSLKVGLGNNCPMLNV